MYRSVRKYRFQGFNFRWLYRTEVGFPFALRSPALGQSVGPTSDAATSALVGLVSSGTGLHSPSESTFLPSANSQRLYLFISYMLSSKW